MSLRFGLRVHKFRRMKGLKNLFVKLNVGPNIVHVGCTSLILLKFDGNTSFDPLAMSHIFVFPID